MDHRKHKHLGLTSVGDRSRDGYCPLPIATWALEEGVGFEPTCAVAPGGFQDRSLVATWVSLRGVAGALTGFPASAGPHGLPPSAGLRPYWQG